MNLNLGSGEQLLKGYINFDCIKISKNGQNTNLLGKIQDISMLLKPNMFDTIIAFHSLEHINRLEVIKALRDCFSLLKYGGNLIVEGPDIIGAYEYYVNRKKNIEGYINCLYAEDFNLRKIYGEGWSHKSGWTGTIMANTMEKVGFKIKHTGVGLSHGMGIRDFRVEGVKS
jgi:predicted SAM-dependent methyltransferase